MNFIIRCDVGTSIGMGHYSRCGLLIKALRKRNIEAQIAIKYMEGNKESSPPFAYDLLIEGDDSKEAEYYKFQNSYLILDTYHQENVNTDYFQAYLSSLKVYRNKIALLEGLGEEACPLNYYPYLDAIITPYAVGKLPKSDSNILRLHGKKYLLLDEEKIIRAKNIRLEAKNLLITFGGSDPHHQTEEMIKVLAQDKRFQRLQLKVVLGPLMSHQTQQKVKEMAKTTFPSNIEIISGIDNLSSCFDWADLAITNTGQTRYELAASGVPFIICPFDKVGYEASLVFANSGCAILQEWPNSLCNTNDVVADLHANFDQRSEMSKRGVEEFFVPEGADNIVEDLLKAWQ